MADAEKDIRKRAMTTQAWVSLLFTLLVIAMAPVRIRILTRALSKSEYAILSLLTMTAAAIGFIALLGQRQFLIYSLPGKDNRDRAKYFNSTLVTTAIGGAIGAVVFLVLGLTIPSMARVFSTRLLLAGSCYIALYALVNLGMGYLLAIGKVIHYRALTFIVSSLWVLAAIALLSWIKLNVGQLAALWLAGLAASSLLCAYWVRPRSNRARFEPPDWSTMKNGIRYGVPIIPRNFANFLMTLADRYVILFLLGTGHVAVYTVPATLVIFATQVQNFLEFLFPHLSETWKDNLKSGRAGCSGQASVLYHTMLRLSVLTALPLAAGICLWGPSLVRILAGAGYTEGTVVFSYLVPLVIIIPLTSFVHFALMLDGRTKTIGFSILAAAALNVLLNIVLVTGSGPIPALGIRGAALATTLSYTLLFVISLVVSGVAPRLSLSKLHVFALIGSCLSFIAVTLLLRNRMGSPSLWEIPIAAAVFFLAGHVMRLWTKQELLLILQRTKRA